MGTSVAVSSHGRSIFTSYLAALFQLTVASKERQMDLVEVLGFLFMLSTMELGKVVLLLLFLLQD